MSAETLTEVETVPSRRRSVGRWLLCVGLMGVVIGAASTPFVVIASVAASAAAVFSALSFALGLAIASRCPAPQPWRDRNLLTRRVWTVVAFVSRTVMLGVGVLVAIVINDYWRMVMAGDRELDGLPRYMGTVLLLPAAWAGLLVAALWLLGSLVRMGLAARQQHVLEVVKAAQRRWPTLFEARLPGSRARVIDVVGHVTTAAVEAPIIWSAFVVVPAALPTLLF